MQRITSRTVLLVEKLVNHQDLHKSPLFCLGIVRLLDERTTQLFFSLLVSSIHITRIDEIEGGRESLGVLDKLKIIRHIDGAIRLSEDFRDAFLIGVSDIHQKKLDKQLEEAGSSMDEDFSSRSRFLKLLNLIVNKATARDSIMKGFLLSAGLVDEYDNITNAGFEFLLQSRSEQLWQVMLHGIKYFAKNQKNESEMLSLLMEISLIKTGTVCRIKKWDKIHDFLETIGVFRRTKEGVVMHNEYFFSDFETSNELKERYLVIETNFKIYAYTSRLYEKSILNLFSKAVSVLPNLIKTHFDEESFVCAYKKGITAAQIIRYLKEHSVSLPRNVENQLKIWENNMKRIKAKNAVMFSNFNHLSDYQALLHMLTQNNALLFCDEQKRIIIAKEELYKHAKAFLKDLRS